MAEILNSGVNHYFKDVATSGGNTIIGAAVPTDFATQGISKEAGESGVFIYTDKSFTIYFCYGGTWVQYMAVDATDSDFANSISIPWADHDTHGAVTGMYFVTAEADHEIRAVKISGDLITDFIPTDADLTKNALIVDETSVSNTGSVIEGAGTYFNYEHDLSGKSVGDTISYTLNGVVGGALTFMDTYTQVQTTILYNAETGQSAISFVLPAEWNSSKAINTFSRGGSPLSDPFTRGVSAPTGNLALFINMNDNANILDSAGAAADDTDAIQTINATGGSLVQTTAAKQPQYIVNGKNMYNGITGTQDSIYLPQPGLYSGEDGFDFTPFAWDNGFTFAYSFANNSKRYTGGSYRTMIKANDANGTNTTFELVISENMEAANDKCKIRLRFKPDGQAYIYQYDSAEGVITPHQFNNILAVWDGSAERPTVKVNGVEVEFGAYSTKTGSYNVSQYPQYSSYGPYGVFGDFAAYSSGLSGTDLEQLEAYYDFKYVTLPSSELMFQDLSKNYAGGFNGESPVDSDYIDGVVTNTACYAFPEKYFKLGTRAEMTVSYAAVHLSNYQQYFIMPRSKWNFIAKARNYHYVPAYQVRYTPESAYGVYHRNYGTGVMYAVETGDDNFSYLNNPGAPTGNMNPGDTVGFIVEWDGTMKLTQNGAVIFTYPDKLTEDFIFVPIGVFGDWKLDMSGHMVDFDAMDDIYERFEGAELVTPTLVEDNGAYGLSSIMTLGGINANVASTAHRKGKIQIGSLQGAGSYIEFVNANYPVANQLFNMIIDTDSSNYDAAAAPYAVKRITSHMSRFWVNGSDVVGFNGTVSSHFGTRPFFGEWPYWHPEEYWETHGDDDTVENKTVGPCRIQLMEGNKLVWFVNGYPVWEQAGFDVTQKWYINIDNHHNNGCVLEGIKIKSVQ